MGSVGWRKQARGQGTTRQDRAVPMGLGQQTQMCKRGLGRTPCESGQPLKVLGVSGFSGALDGLCLGRWRPSVFKRLTQCRALFTPSAWNRATSVSLMARAGGARGVWTDRAELEKMQQLRSDQVARPF